jgi:hypothetical protein
MKKFLLVVALVFAVIGCSKNSNSVTVVKTDTVKTPVDTTLKHSPDSAFVRLKNCTYYTDAWVDVYSGKDSSVYFETYSRDTTFTCLKGSKFTIDFIDDNPRGTERINLTVTMDTTIYGAAN